MTADSTVAPSKAMFWAGWIVSILPVLMLVLSATMKFVQPAGMAEDLSKIGWDLEAMTTLGVVEATCVVLYLVPQTAVLGAILLTGYLGGATATHARVGDPSWIAPVVFGVLVWLGVYLRDRRLRELIPWRKS